MTRIIIVATLLLVGATRVQAQRSAADTMWTRHDTAQIAQPQVDRALMWPAGALGAFAGLYAGATIGNRHPVCIGGGDDPCLNSILLFGAAGAAIGSAAGVA